MFFIFFIKEKDFKVIGVWLVFLVMYIILFLDKKDEEVVLRFKECEIDIVFYVVVRLLVIIGFIMFSR